MAFHKQHVFVGVLIVYFLTWTILAVVATFKTQFLHLPISIAESLLTIILPVITAILFFLPVYSDIPSSSHAFSAGQIGSATDSNPRIRFPSLLILTGLLVWTVILGTLTASTHLTPWALTGLLRAHWQDLFKAKNDVAIKAIQDHLDCCGFTTMRDMPWPFPSDASHIGATTCMENFGRTFSCQARWADEMKIWAGVMLACHVGVGLWILGTILTIWVKSSMARGNYWTSFYRDVDDGS